MLITRLCILSLVAALSFACASTKLSHTVNESKVSMITGEGAQKISDAEKNVATIETEISKTKNEITSQESTINDAKSKVDAADSEVSTAKKYLESKELFLDSQKKLRDVSEQKKSVLEAQQKEQEALLMFKKASVEMIKFNEVSAAEGAQGPEHEKQKANFLTQLAEREKTYADEKINAANNLSKLADLQGEYEKIKSEYLSRRKEFESNNNSDFEKLKSQSLSSTQKIESLQKKNSELQNTVLELKGSKQKLEVLHKDKHQQLQESQKQLQESTSKNVEFQKQKTDSTPVSTPTKTEAIAPTIETPSEVITSEKSDETEAPLESQ